jgi:CheY-like chemotaxis protein
MIERISSPLRVLLVDDCPDVRGSIATLLRLWGHDVRTVGDGAACLAAAVDYRPHVVLLDVGLPDMDGYEVARRLRAHPPEPSLLLITLSGYGLEEDFLRSRLAGCDRHRSSRSI